MRGNLTAVLCWLALCAAGIVAAQEGQAAITSPIAGEILFGEVQLAGSATHPEFRRYQLEFATADQPDEWFPVQEPVSQQVTAGILGVWNTTGLPDGVYWIRLRVFLRDGTWFEAGVDDLQVSNTQPTPVPTALLPPTEPPTAPPPTAGPSPTPIIQQPPTSTPRRGAAPSASGGAGAGGRGGADDPWLSVGPLQSACCAGVYFSLAAFALLALYAGVQSSLRPWVRRLWRNIRRSLR